MFSNPTDSTLATSSFFVPQVTSNVVKSQRGVSLGKMFVKYAADGMLTSPGGEEQEVLELSTA